MTQVKSILTVVFLLAVAIGLMTPWIFSHQPKVQSSQSTFSEALKQPLPEHPFPKHESLKQSAVSEKKPQQNSNIASVSNENELNQDQSPEINELLNYCETAQEPLCLWIKTLVENSDQYPGKSELLTWLVNKWQVSQSPEDRMALEIQIKQALLAEEEAFESYQKAVQAFLEQDLANSSIEDLKARMQSMEQHILAMKLQGMTETEAELLRLRLRAAQIDK